MEVDEIAKLSQSDIEIILDLYKKGETFTNIAKKFNVSRSSVTRRIKEAGAYRLETSKECVRCGKTFYPSNYGSQIQKFCSDNSRQHNFWEGKERPKKLSNCQYCDTEFEVGRRKTYCSEECAKKHNNLEKKKKWRFKKCRYCEKWRYGFNGKYCSEQCRKRAKRIKDELSKSERLKRARSNGQFDADIDIYKLIERDGGRCYLCGDDVLFSYHYNHPKYPTIEHVMPISKGGAHSWDNVKVACRECNTYKSATLIDDFLKGR
ncbi:HNH endonuclease [Staphylococcus ureilyticus]|uniref:HNH endonuclease n=1 Tax=Staphylococcus ureilyticus TaxID=94138 RepID=UPI0034DD1500